MKMIKIQYKKRVDFLKITVAILAIMISWILYSSYTQKYVYAMNDTDWTFDISEETGEEINAVPEVVVVIDAGHGGKNEGAVYGGYVEKELTLRTALAMKQELEKYEGIRVYMTREEDKDLELTERTAYANEVCADFFVCLHYNMSELHKLYGAECWISSFGRCYADGKDFSDIEMEMLTGLGLYDRGIKTRLNSKGTDYYGVIRSATEYNIPSVIIEHCHLDQEEDAAFIDKESWPEKYGVLDATALARYFGLQSAELNVDFSQEVHEKTPVPDERIEPDTTPPEWCVVTDFSVDEESAVATGRISAYDPDSRILYYTASFDNGETFHEYYRYEPDEKGEVSFEIKLPKNCRVGLVIGVLNMYGGLAESDVLYAGEIREPADEEELAGDESEAGLTGQIVEIPKDNEDRVNADNNLQSQEETAHSLVILAFCIIAFCVPLILYFILRYQMISKKKKIKRLRRVQYHYEADNQKKLEQDLIKWEKERTAELVQRASENEDG